MVREARRRNVEGVICGHVHTPEIRDIDGILYCNDGDWVETCSALVEHMDGRLELLDWSTFDTVKVLEVDIKNPDDCDRRLASPG